MMSRGNTTSQAATVRHHNEVTDWVCADCLRPVNANGPLCCPEDAGWHHATAADMLACPGTAIHVQAIPAESVWDDPPEWDDPYEDETWVAEQAERFLTEHADR